MEAPNPRFLFRISAKSAFVSSCERFKLPIRQNSERMIISDTLIEKGLLAPEQLREALALQRAEGLRLDRAIVQKGFLTERQILGVISEQLHLPFMDLSEMTIDPPTLRSVPLKIVFRKRVVPILRHNGSVTYIQETPHQ